ncbi:hypothetical protein BCR35DRAFT_303983 [Leucosporidium creatinivorum]|uniref:Uncharacterized protein n=1 Tax=Leucosporidium creatinivorum TaxID=106004 RepID=A0A1Y2FD16_9BASI|nr:hypothetical protein BCR35DRAFT_303983 [Leucosporidium creatinivorum]
MCGSCDEQLQSTAPYLQPPSNSLDRLPTELKGEIVRWASFGAEKNATLASLRLLSWDFCYYATPLSFKEIELWPERNGPLLFQRFHEDVALRHGSLVQRIIIEARTEDINLDSHPLTLDDALMLRRIALILPHLCNLTRLHLDILPATAGDFEYEPQLDLLGRVPLPFLEWLALTAYCTRPMDPIRLAETIRRFKGVRHLSIAGVVWTHGGELAEAIVSLPLVGLRIDDVDGPIIRHLAQADLNLSITHLAIIDCPATTLADLHLLFVRLARTLTHLKLEIQEELPWSSPINNAFPFVLQAFTLRAPPEHALPLLSYFRQCPFTEFRLEGSLEAELKMPLYTMLIRAVRDVGQGVLKRVRVEVRNEKEREAYEQWRPVLQEKLLYEVAVVAGKF